MKTKKLNFLVEGEFNTGMGRKSVECTIDIPTDIDDNEVLNWVDCNVNFLELIPDMCMCYDYKQVRQEIKRPKIMHENHSANKSLLSNQVNTEALAKTFISMSVNNEKFLEFTNKLVKPTDRLALVKLLYEDFDPTMTYEHETGTYYYLDSGSTRSVWVNEDFTKVIKLASIVSDKAMCYRMNAYEFFSYYSRFWQRELSGIQSVKTKWFSDCSIQQDFVYRINKSRAGLNSEFAEMLNIDRSSYFVEIYGAQVGWHPEHKRFEMFDTADELLDTWTLDSEFEIVWSTLRSEWYSLEWVQQQQWRNSVFAKLHEDGLLQEFFDNRHECYLLHQDGILINDETKSITLCNKYDTKFAIKLQNSLAYTTLLNDISTYTNIDKNAEL